MTFSPTIGGLVKPGRWATFVRWFPKGEGWDSETVEGRYLGATDDHWLISRGGVRVELPRPEWNVCSA